MDKDSIVKVIEKWKAFWMNQTQNSEADYKNYLHRALGVDANMKYHLADKVWEAVDAELKKKDERIAELIRWHEKKDRHVEQLEGFVISVAPSWLPEGIRAHRRELIKRMGLDTVVKD